jgi:hypothetical protein
VASRAIGRPLIGVTSSRSRGRVMWWFNRIALWRAGARSRRLCAGASFAVDDFDGFVIGGGDDIDAALYRGEIEPAIRCIGLDLIGQLSDLGVCLRASDRSAQQATATGWLC